jgi:16S rRNA processing protein RimM
MRLRPETDFPERLQGRRVWLQGPSPRWSVIGAAQPYRRGFFIVHLEGVGDRDAAESLRGYEVQVPVEELPPLPEGEYYHHEIVGLRVEDEAGADLGRIVAIERTGANDVYAVERGDGRRWLLPAVRDVVLRIDVAAGLLVVRPLPGLID